MRLEIWENEENQKKYEAVGGATSCGGIPFFFNSETGQSICGATRCENLMNWAKRTKL